MIVPLATKGNMRLLEQAECADDIYMYGGVYDEFKLNEPIGAFAQLQSEYL